MIVSDWRSDSGMTAQWAERVRCCCIFIEEVPNWLRTVILERKENITNQPTVLYLSRRPKMVPVPLLIMITHIHTHTLRA